MPLTSTNPATAQALHPAFRLILPYLRPIERLILDPEISEIMINSPNDVFIEKYGVLERVPEVTISADQLRVAVQNIARSLGDDISEEKPILDSRLPDGSRIAAVLPPCSIQGITLTIRKFNARSFTIHDLIRIGTISNEMAAYLQASILARKNILISGVVYMGFGILFVRPLLTGSSNYRERICFFSPPLMSGKSASTARV